MELNQKKNFKEQTGIEPVTAGLVVVGVCGVLFLTSRYRVAKPQEYLIRTGLGISDINIVKKGFQWPFQRMQRLCMLPRNYSFRLHAMSNEKMEFVLPGVFTIGPRNEPRALIDYSRYMMDNAREDQTNIIMGLIEGETRALAASMSIEDVFRDRSSFREAISEAVGMEMDKFGLQIFNANVKELEDAEGSEYFLYMRQRTREGAANQAKVDVAEAKYKGDVGSKSRERSTRMEVAGFESEAVAKENERDVQISMSNKERRVAQAEFERAAQIAEIESSQAARLREAELQKAVEDKVAQYNTAKLRADLVAHATARGDSAVVEAEAEAKAVRVKADADLYQKETEAKGIAAVYNAQAEGVTNVLSSLGGDTHALLNFEMINRGLFPELARINAGAIQGLNPKITVWNTGPSSSTGESPYVKTIRDVAQAVPPLLSTISDQTGIKWNDMISKSTESPSSTTPPSSSSASISSAGSIDLNEIKRKLNL